LDNATGVAVVGTDFMDSGGALWLCSTNDYATAPIKVAQTVSSHNDTGATFDVVPTGLSAGTVYAFWVTSLGQVSPALAVTLESSVDPGGERLLLGTVTTGTTSATNNRLWLRKFTAAQTGTLTKIGAYTYGAPGGSLKLGIYADNAGAPGDFLAGDDVGIAAEDSQWNYKTGFSVSITAGVDYWLACNSSALGALSAAGPTGGTTRYAAADYAGFEFPETLPSLTSSGVRVCLIAYGFDAPEIDSISDATIFYRQKGVVLSGSGFGASGGSLWLSAEDDFASDTKVLQTITAQDDESLTFDVVPGALLSGPAYLFFVTADGGRNAEGFPVTFAAQVPDITSVNGGVAILASSKSVPVLGTGLGAVIVLADNEDLDIATMAVTQSIRYAFSTLVVFDVVLGGLESGTVYAFSISGGKRNTLGFPVTLSAETMPASTVAADAVATLPTQFDNAETTKGFLAALLSPFDEIDSALQFLDTRASFQHGAAGTWLDSEVQIIGAKRGAFSVPENLFFTFGPSREGGPVAKSETQGFNAGYLRSRFGNELAGTLKGDVEYADHLLAKSLATFRGTALCDIEDFVYELFDVVCRAEFVAYSDVYLYPDEPLSLVQKDAINLYAPVSAGSILTIIEE
jgi:hypothetical protein